jgi:2'-5' RNA ligase
VLVEAHVDGVFPPPPFLPHLSIGYFRRSEPVDRLRDKLVPLRAVELGSGIVEEVLLCDVPYAKTTFYEPWTIVDTIRLGKRSL